MKLVALVFFLFALAFIVCETLEGCTPAEQQTAAENVENAAAVAQYKALLVECRNKGKAAKSYAVYEACADAIDAELCRVRSLRCDGGAP